MERFASGVAGGLAIGWGLRNHSLSGITVALLGTGLLHRAVSGECPMYRALGVSTEPERGPTKLLPRMHAARPEHYEVIREVTIAATPAQVYAAWKRPETQARVMGHFAQLEQAHDGRTVWTIQGPMGRRYTWQTQIIEDKPDEAVRFQSVSGVPLLKRGGLKLRNAPRDRGTEVSLHLHFERPQGWVGDALESLLGGVPSALAQRALFNLKCELEAGELPSLKHNPAARRQIG